MIKMGPKTLKRLRKKIPQGAPDQERESRASDIVDRWFEGVSQNIKGAVRTDFIENFMARFIKEERTDWEKRIEKCYGMKDPARFRKEIIMLLATMYHNAQIDAGRGEIMNLIQLMDESNDRVSARFGR
jgi:hypothetical protein